MRNFDANWFLGKRGFSFSFFCAVSAETKLETEKTIGTRLRWVCSKAEIMRKKGGVLVGVVFTNLDKIGLFRTVYFATLPVFCGNEARNGFPKGVLGSELLRTFTPNSEMPQNNGTRFALIFWFLLFP